jgi:hypothetical protein
MQGLELDNEHVFIDHVFIDLVFIDHVFNMGFYEGA